MSLDNLPPLPRLIHPEANDYAARCLAATRRVHERVRTLLDLPYGDDPQQRLDVYLPPATPAAPRGLPVLVFFHGGAWTSGTKEWMGFMAPPLLDIPAILVSANYRLAPGVRHPQPLQDCLAAIAWVWRHIAGHGGDPRRLFVGGHSAGAHLAALATLDRTRRRAAGLPPDAIRGCLTVSGSYELRHRDAAPGSMERRAYELFLARDEDDADASPIAHVHRQAPPFLIAWGERDFPRLIPQAHAMAAALRTAGVEVQALEMPGVDHFGASEICGDDHAEWCALVRGWLARS